MDPSYGKLGLDLMRAGRSAPDALKGLLAADASRDVRQVAFIDAQGNVAAWTGARDIDSAGHVVGGKPSSSADRLCPGETDNTGACGFYGTGKNFSVEANMMLNDKVWPAMAKAFESTKGDLAERMMAALEAAQAVGGDIRGRQSAALIVVSGKPTGKSWQDRVFDLRVDDNPEPLKELRRLLIINRAYNHMNAGDLAVEHKDNEGALREYSAASRLVENVEGVPASRKAEMMFWHAVALVTMNRTDEALPLFKRVYAIDENWRTLARRLPKSGLLPDDPKLIERITAK